jgi:hypothetical protein
MEAMTAQQLIMGWNIPDYWFGANEGVPAKPAAM